MYLASWKLEEGCLRLTQFGLGLITSEPPQPLLCRQYLQGTALGWELEIALYVFTLQLHATLNALQEHGDHPAINWPCFLGKEAGDGYWGISVLPGFLMDLGVTL